MLQNPQVNDDDPSCWEFVSPVCWRLNQDRALTVSDIIMGSATIAASASDIATIARRFIFIDLL